MVDKFDNKWFKSIKESDLVNLTRNELISWLKWNNPKGVYLDEESIRKYGEKMPYEEAYWAVLKELD
jgi:hypothetical protein